MGNKPLLASPSVQRCWKLRGLFKALNERAQLPVQVCVMCSASQMTLRHSRERTVQNLGIFMLGIFIFIERKDRVWSGKCASGLETRI